MNESTTPGPRRIPEDERKFSAHLSAELYLSGDEQVEVIICGERESAEDGLLDSVSDTLRTHGFEDVRLIGSVLLSATVYPPDVKTKLTIIAGNNDVSQIILAEPLMPITVPKSHFR